MMTKKKMRGYVFGRPFMGERVPQHVQNFIVRDYCERNSFQFLLSVSEYIMEDCHLIFEQALEELPQIDGIALYSVFQLPRSQKQRHAVYTRVLGQKKTLYFAVEGLKMENEADMSRIETLWLVRQAMDGKHGAA